MAAIKTNTGVTAGAILDAHGEVVGKPTQVLTSDEARLLREYKKFLLTHGMREALYCNDCFAGNLDHDGMRAHVTDGQIMFECRHRMLFYQGQSF